MKLLLTSAGITNDSIASAIKRSLKRPIKIAFIPTAANVSNSNKTWLIDDFNACRKLGSIDIVDISAIPKSMWLRRLKKANVIVFGGGKTSHLMKCVISSGLKKELPNLLKHRLYVGISAGSIITCKTLQASSEFIYGDEEKIVPKGLGYVNFNIRPHLNSPQFPRVNDKNLKELSKKLDGDLYAIDDNSAVFFNSGKIEIISEGRHIVYKKE